LRVAWKFVGGWYKWGGDDPGGFDCSGLVIEILKSVGLLPRRFDDTAKGLAERFAKQKCSTPAAGRLAFYANEEGEIVHVEFCVDRAHTIGASGGGPWVRNLDEAMRSNAFIKVRPVYGGRVPKLFVDPFEVFA